AEAWPFATGLGGVFGDAIFFAVRGPLTMLDETWSGAIVAGAALLLSAGFLFFFFDLRPHDMRDGAQAAARAWAMLRRAMASVRAVAASLRDGWERGRELAIRRGWLSPETDDDTALLRHDIPDDDEARPARPARRPRRIALEDDAEIDADPDD